MNNKAKLLINLVAGFWIVVGAVNSIGCLMGTFAMSAVKRNTPDPTIMIQLLPYISLFCAVALAFAVYTGIQLIHRKNWARVVLQGYAWVILAINCTAAIFWFVSYYPESASHIGYVVTKWLMLSLLPILLILATRSKSMRSETSFPNHGLESTSAPPAAGTLETHP